LSNFSTNKLNNMNKIFSRLNKKCDIISNDKKINKLKNKIEKI
jgi:hypothetical protein